MIACCVVGCSDCAESEAAPAPASEQSAPLAEDKPAEPAPAAPKTPPPVPYPAPGWFKVLIRDQVPICVFTDYAAHHEAQFIEQVTKQKLSADASVVMGAFGPWCVNEACDDLPSLECAVKREGNTLVVSSRYWGTRKYGATCKDVVCRQVTAGCQTPPLEAGVYTVQHGERSFEFRVPGVLRSPCFGTEPLAPPEGPEEQPTPAP
jgi:hypothetical protein